MRHQVMARLREVIENDEQEELSVAKKSSSAVKTNTYRGGTASKGSSSRPGVKKR